MKGIPGFDNELALGAMVKGANGPGKQMDARVGHIGKELETR